MRVLVFKMLPDELDAFQGDLVVAVVGEDERPLKAVNAWLDWRLYGSLSESIKRKYFSGALGEKCLIPTYGKFEFDRLVLVGGGRIYETEAVPSEEAGHVRWNHVSNLIADTVQSLKVKRVGLALPRFEVSDHERALIRILQTSRLPQDTALFLSRASSSITPLGL